jgi:hypothetical protein
MSEWVNCPVCGQPDMEQTTSKDGDKLIACTNHACLSNGGSFHTVADTIARLTREHDAARKLTHDLGDPIKAKTFFVLKISECWSEAPPSVVDWIADACIGIVPNVAETARKDRDAALADNAALVAAFRSTHEIVKEWCKQIKETGTGWDDWDEYYKQMAYGGNDHDAAILSQPHPGDPLLKRLAELKFAAQALADAADSVGVKHFDTDSMDASVESMQSATLRVRDLLKAG